jgi:hypothetical protein
LGHKAVATASNHGQSSNGFFSGDGGGVLAGIAHSAAVNSVSLAVAA